MSDKKISELPIASTINPTDLSVLVSSGTNYQFAFSTLLQFISSGLSVGANITFGTTLPQNTAGKNGDVFINTSAGSFAQRVSGAWVIAYTLPASGGMADGTVLYGLGVPANTAGNNNDTYINTGTGVFYRKSGGTWAQVFSMQTGPAGPQGTAGTNGTNGTNGKTILNGTTDPSNLSTGTDGDFYINTNTFTFFGPKASGVWPAGTSLAGADGATGPTGTKGDTGNTGPAGQGVVTGGTTGQILAKIDNTDYHTQWVTPSGGGAVSGLTPNELLFGKSDGTITQDSELQYDPSTKSLYKGVEAAPASGGNIIYIGDSITYGGGASMGLNKFSTLLSTLLGMTEINVGRNGTTLGNPVHVDSALVNNLSLIPIPSESDKYLVFEYGANDVDNYTGAGASYLGADFNTDYTSVINNALSKGWKFSQIVILSIPYINPFTQSISATDFNTRLNSFNAVIFSLASTFNLILFDIQELQLTNGIDFLSSDGLHPNDLGHFLIAMGIYSKLVTKTYQKGLSLTINDITELANLKLTNFNLISDNQGFIVGRKPDGSIGVLYSIPNNTRVAGNLYPDGGLIQVNVPMPDPSTFPGGMLGKYDDLRHSNSKQVAVYSPLGPWGTYGPNPLWFNIFELADSGMNMNWKVGNANGTFQWFIGSTLALTINRDLGASYENYLHLELNKKIYGDYSDIEGGFIPLLSSAETRIYNQFKGGTWGVWMSGGLADGNLNRMLRMGSSGRMLLQTSVDGDDLTDVTCAKLALNSEDEGFLMPRMSTTQRNNMSNIFSLNIVGNGTGYTNASIVFDPPTGGGTTATAICTLSAGGIIDVVFTNKGSGYITIPSFTVTGDGSGFSATVILNLVEGLQIYNLDTHRVNTYNGSQWMQVTESIA